MAALLREHVSQAHSGKTRDSEDNLFFTVRSGRPTRMTEDNVRHLARHYGTLARENCKEVPENVHPHLFRHSRAMHLYEHGIDACSTTVRSSAWTGARPARRSPRSCTATCLPRPEAASVFEMACPGGRVPPRRFAAPLAGTAPPVLPGRAWPSAHIRRDLRLKPALQA